MVSFRMSGKPTLYGLLALSVMEIVASQKPGSPLAILQQPTQGFNALTVAVSSPQTAPPPQPGSPTPLKTNRISLITTQAPSFAQPALSSTASQGNAAMQQAIPTQPPSFKATSFKDLQSHWSQPFVELLAARGIVSGYTDGTFQPDRNIQAAHFGIMLHQAKLYRLKVRRREQAMVISSTTQISPPSLHEPLSASTTSPIAETEATDLLRSHNIRTRAQAAVFIYRNLQAPLVGNASATDSLAVQTAPASRPWQILEPTFSESDEDQTSPGLSEAYQWSVIEPDWVAQG